MAAERGSAAARGVVVGPPRRGNLRVDPDLDLEAAHGVDVGFLSFFVPVLDPEAQPIESGQRLGRGRRLWGQERDRREERNLRKGR